MFRTVPLSIIMSFSLYTQQRYMSYRFADSLRAESCSQAAHCTSSNSIGHTGLLTACEQDQDGTAVPF